MLWVFFTDKAILDQSSFAAALSKVEGRMTEAARARRARETGGRFVPDWYDLPVAPEYVAAVARSGASVRHVSRWLNAMTVVADEPQARAIAQLPFVRIITPARASRKAETVGMAIPSAPPPPGEERSAPRLPAEWLGSAPSLPKPSPGFAGYGNSYGQLNGINAVAAQDSGWSGATVVVAMFDTGYDKNHPALSPLLRIAERDFIFGDGETANQGQDVNGQWDHGSGTWSVLGGYAPGSQIGPAFNARFLLAKTEDVRSETPVEEDNWVAAVEWADSLGADVISSSLAYLDFDGTVNDYSWTDLNGYTTVVTLGAIMAARRGIMVANAMGNEGSGGGRTLWAPADAESILACGAVDSNDLIADFSSRGNTSDGRIKPEVVAQGVLTWWAVAGSTSYAAVSGTSLATPLVGGAAALVREAHPEWTVAQVRQAIISTADKAATPDSVYGWGRVNVVAAIYGSSLGPPVFPRPFDLVVPVNNATVTQAPVTFRWRKTTDPQGGVLNYTVDLRCVGSDSCVYHGAATTDTFQVYTGYLGPSRTYEWFVTATDPQGHGRISRDRFRFSTSATTDVGVPAAPPAPPRVALLQNRPNPVRSGLTQIEYSLTGPPGAVRLTLRIFDVRGRLIRSLLDIYQAVPADCSIRWNGLDENGRAAGSGIYYYRLEVAGASYSKRLVLVR